MTTKAPPAGAFRLNARGDLVEPAFQAREVRPVDALVLPRAEAPYYNSAILSRLLTMHMASVNKTALTLITSASSVAGRHVHLNGRYSFRDGGQAIDLDTIIRALNL